MDLFGEARKMLGKAATGVSRGADMVRLETEAAELSRQSEADWAAAGRRAQYLLRMGRLQDKELATLVQKAEDMEEKLLACQRAMQQVRGGKRPRRCPACNALITELRENCHHCDAKLPVCQNCLEPLSAGDRACPSCQQPVDVPSSST